MRQTFVLSSPAVRHNAIRAIQGAPDGYEVTVRPRVRSHEQNSMLWALLTDISRQVRWCDRTLSAEDWKTLFSALLRHQQVIPGIEGGLVVLGLSTSQLTKGEFSQLLESILAFGSEKGVQWSDAA